MRIFDMQPLASVPDKSEVYYNGKVVEYIYSTAGKATMYEPGRGVFYLNDTEEVTFVRKL